MATAGQGLVKGTWLRLRANGKSGQDTDWALVEKRRSGACQKTPHRGVAGTDDESNRRTAHSQGLVLKSTSRD